ncbi:MAG: hypothetical protein ACE5JJ_01830 [Nitrospinota bacterium]
MRGGAGDTRVLGTARTAGGAQVGEPGGGVAVIPLACEERESLGEPARRLMAPEEGVDLLAADDPSPGGTKAPADELACGEPAGR